MNEGMRRKNIPLVYVSFSFLPPPILPILLYLLRPFHDFVVECPNHPFPDNYFSRNNSLFSSFPFIPLIHNLLGIEIHNYHFVILIEYFILKGLIGDFMKK
jgi:hypothetical protein